MRNKNGNALAQYAIIIALVALALIPVFLVFGKTIVDQFNYFYKCLSGSGEATQQTVQPVNQSGNQSNVVETPAPVVEEGSLGGTPSQPVKKCSDGNCMIDFGDYVLSGIPDNFQEYVESAGTSGGTDKLSSLLMQIARQLKEQGDDAGYQQYKDLANLGHFIGDIQNTIENQARVCQQNNTQSSTCLLSTTPSNLTDAPSNISHILTDYNNKELYKHSDYSARIDYARKWLTDDSTDKATTTSSPSFAFVELYDDIMSNNNYSDNLKAITKQLYVEIADLGQSQNITVMRAQGQTNQNLYDPLTGEFIESLYVEGIEDFGNIYTPQISRETDLNSALICTTGKNNSDGNACH